MAQRRGRRDDERMGISPEAVADYVDRAVDSMVDIVSGLGDDVSNQRPDLPGANSPHVILRHCLGVMEYWGGHVVAGRDVERDRDAEFRSAGAAAELAEAAGRAKRQLRADVAAADPEAPPRRPARSLRPGELEARTQGHALLHILEEVTQHLGQAEITRDLLARPAGR